MGPEEVLVVLKSYSDGKRRGLLKKVLGFNVLLASLQVDDPDKEIFCASLNMGRF